MITAVVSFSVGIFVWMISTSRNASLSDANPSPNVASTASIPEETQKAIPGNPRKDGPSEGSHADRNSTSTMMIDLHPVKDTPFIARDEPLAPDQKHWNKSRNFHIMRSSVWYELYDGEDNKVCRLPSYINVEATGNPNSRDKFARDIQWQWYDDFRIIGVEQIARKELKAPPIGLESEFPEIAPDSSRIYLFDVRNLDVVYELKLPDSPIGLAVRLEGIADNGDLSLAALSPSAYNRGDDLKNDPKHYRYLGRYRLDETKQSLPDGAGENDSSE